MCRKNLYGIPSARVYQAWVPLLFMLYVELNTNLYHSIHLPLNCRLQILIIESLFVFLCFTLQINKLKNFIYKFHVFHIFQIELSFVGYKIVAHHVSYHHLVCSLNCHKLSSHEFVVFQLLFVFCFFLLLVWPLLAYGCVWWIHCRHHRKNLNNLTPFLRHWVARPRLIAIGF